MKKLNLSVIAGIARQSILILFFVCLASLAFSQSNTSAHNIWITGELQWKEGARLDNDKVAAIEALIVDSSDVSAVPLDATPDIFLTKAGYSMKYVLTNALGALTSTGAVTAASGMDLGTSQALIGTTAMTIGNNAQTVAINSSDWDIGATGICTGLGNITSDGDLIITGGDITGANGNAVDIGEATDGTIVFSRDDAGTVTLTSADSDANAALTIGAGGTGAFTLGDVGSTTAISSSAWTVSATGVTTGLLNTVINNTDESETLTAAQSGITVTFDGAGTATIPDASSATVGVVYYLIQTADANLTVTATTADNNSIVCNGVATSDNVSITTASHKIGAGMIVMGISATQWYVGGLNPESLLTPEAAD